MVFFSASLLMTSILMCILQVQVVSLQVKSNIANEDIIETTTDNVVSLKNSIGKFNSSSSSMTNSVQVQRRDDAGIIPDVFQSGIFCELLEALFIRDVECTCKRGFNSFIPYLQSKCDREVRPIVGGSYTVSVTTQLVPIIPFITSKICLERFTILGLVYWGPVCFGYAFDTDNRRSIHNTNYKVRSCNTNKMAECVISGRAKKIKKSSNIVKDCTVTIGSGADAITCNSCTPCNKIGGVKFDCTNVGIDLQTDTCFNLLPYRGPGSNPSLILPNLVLTNGTTIELS